MTEPDAPDPIPSTPAEPPERVRIEGPPPRQRRDFLPALYLLGFLVLAGALFYLYRNPSMPAGVEQEAARGDALQQQVAALTGRLDDLERRPAPMPAPAPSADLGPLEARVSALEPKTSSLEPRLAALEPGFAALEPKLSELEQKVSALEQRPGPPPPDFGPVIAQVDAGFSKQDAELSKQAAGLLDLAGQLDAVQRRAAELLSLQAAGLQDLASRVDATQRQDAEQFSTQGANMQETVSRLGTLEGRVAATEKQDAEQFSKQGTNVQEAVNRLGTLEGRVAATEKQGSSIAGRLDNIADRAQLVARTQVVTNALEAGQPLGDIPGSPPALARFAHEAPPTEGGLRQSFNTAAEAAQHASQPAAMDNQPFAARLWTRAQQVVSVRQGDNVVVGDPLNGVLARARQALEAGNVSGAVSALDGLSGPAAAAMADWVGQARALLEARAALSTMAARG